MKFSVENNNKVKTNNAILVINLWLFTVKNLIHPIIGKTPPATPKRQSQFTKVQVAISLQKRVCINK